MRTSYLKKYMKKIGDLNHVGRFGLSQSSFWADRENRVLQLHPDNFGLVTISDWFFEWYMNKPAEWCFMFREPVQGLACAVSPFWSKQSFHQDRRQYDLYSVTIFDQRDSLYIRETAKKYFSTTPNSLNHADVPR